MAHLFHTRLQTLMMATPKLNISEFKQEELYLKFYSYRMCHKQTDKICFDTIDYFKKP